MTFENIEADIDCDCIKSTFSDTEGVYARKVGKSATPKARDFKTHWERSKRPDNLNDCESVCSYKALSIHPWNETTKEIVENHYTESCRIAPGQKKRICVFKLDSEGGKFKKTPLENDDFHHDLYKSDQFIMESILHIDMIAIDV
jgi:hypothetical protein